MSRIELYLPRPTLFSIWTNCQQSITKKENGHA